jgi:hypothetical protein
MAKEIDVTHRKYEEPADGRTAENIRGDIAATRENISETVDRLTDRVQETFDWRSYVQRYPVVAVGAAAGAGLLLSAAFRRRRSPQDRIVEALAESVEDATARLRGAMSIIPRAGVGPGGAVKAAVIGLLARKATQLVEEKLNRRDSGREPGEDDRRHAIDAEDSRTKYDLREH